MVCKKGHFLFWMQWPNRLKARRYQLTGVVSLLFIVLFLPISASISLAQAPGGDKDNPDLHVDGYALFGTNTTAASVVTSGVGNVFIQNNLQIGSNLTVNARISIGSELFILSAATNIPSNRSYLKIAGNIVGALPVTVTPQIQAGQNGQTLILQGTDNAQRVKIQDGNGVQTTLDLPFSLGQFDTMMLIFDGDSTNWVEIYRSDN
jgi:hypothetical protein